jgi:hypothetical protein
MIHLDEMSLDQLYDSTVTAFPFTSKRQHSIQPLKVVSLRWTPFVGLKTLFIKGLVESDIKMYDTVLLFKDVNYNEENENVVPLIATDGLSYRFGKISSKNDVLLRCNCGDYYWRFNRYNYLDGSHWGRCRAKYESKGLRSPANPLEMPGMCKHLIQTVKALSSAGVFE